MPMHGRFRFSILLSILAAGWDVVDEYIYIFVYTLRYIYIYIRTHTHTHIYIYIHILVPMDGVSVVFIVWLWLLHPSALSGTTSSFGWPGIKEDIAARKTLPSGTLMETCLSLRSAWGDVVG